VKRGEKAPEFLPATRTHLSFLHPLASLSPLLFPPVGGPMQALRPAGRPPRAGITDAAVTAPAALPTTADLAPSRPPFRARVLLLPDAAAGP
jgi:hypothetical protein